MVRIIVVLLAAFMSFSAQASVSESFDVEVSSQVKKKKAKAQLKDVVFHVHIHCNNCVNKIVENISFEKGVKDLDVSLEKQTVAIKYDEAKTSEAVLKAAIEELGYEVHGVVEPEKE